VGIPPVAISESESAGGRQPYQSPAASRVGDHVVSIARNFAIALKNVAARTASNLDNRRVTKDLPRWRAANGVRTRGGALGDRFGAAPPGL
jgi:hypothetical protein